MQFFVKSAIILALLLIILPQPTLAQSTPTPEPTPDASCLDATTGKPDPDKVYVALLDQCVNFASFGNTLMNILIILGLLAGGFRISLGFFMVISAQGNPSRLQEGREAVTQALVGMAVVSSAWIMVQFFESFIPSEWFVNLTGGG